MQIKHKLIQDKEKLLKAINSLIGTIIDETKYIKQDKTIFHYSNPPSVSIQGYLRRISSYVHCSPSIYVVALILIDRIQQYNQNFFITPRCIHRLIITSMVVATKAYDDFYFKNSYYSKVAGLSNKEINNLEVKFLQLINFDVSISTQTFQVYLEKLQNYLELNLQHQ